MGNLKRIAPTESRSSRRRAGGRSPDQCRLPLADGNV